METPVVRCALRITTDAIKGGGHWGITPQMNRHTELEFASAVRLTTENAKLS